MILFDHLANWSKFFFKRRPGYKLLMTFNSVFSYFQFQKMHLVRAWFQQHNGITLLQTVSVYFSFFASSGRGTIITPYQVTIL